MKSLLYIPVIHTSADLGTIAKDVAKRGSGDLGEDIWKEHIKTVNGFWDAISNYLDSIDAREVKIYQDGMMAEGEVGQKIVEEGVKSGSKNYQILSRLIQRGAVLVKTEDFGLVKKERDRILKIIQAKSITEKLFSFIKYKLTKNMLLRKRDRFIAERIDNTLKHGEKGIIFIGAYHNVKSKLPKSIQLKEVKDAEKIREYQRLIPFYNKNKQRIAELASYLVALIE